MGVKTLCWRRHNSPCQWPLPLVARSILGGRSNANLPPCCSCCWSGSGGEEEAPLTRYIAAQSVFSILISLSYTLDLIEKCLQLIECQTLIFLIQELHIVGAIIEEISPFIHRRESYWKRMPDMTFVCIIVLKGKMLNNYRVLVLFWCKYMQM